MAHIIKKWEIHGGNYLISNGLIEAWSIKIFGVLHPDENLQPMCYPSHKMDHHEWPIEKLLNLLLLQYEWSIWLKVEIDQSVHPTLSLFPSMTHV